MKYLGIDYGLKKVGLAISEGMLADPYQLFHISSLEDALMRVKRVIDQEKIDQVVIGVPESGEALKGCCKFINRLKSEIPNLVITQVDETLSTQTALELTSKKSEDDLAAAIILQNFLDGKS